MTTEGGPKPVLLAGDMPAEMREFTFSKAQEAMEAHKVEKDMAQQLKQTLEAKTLDEEAHAQAKAPTEGERQEPSHHEEADEDNEGAAGDYGE